MLPLRHTSRWRFAGAIILLVVLLATMAPTVVFDVRLKQVASHDKWAHFIAFFFLAVWFSGQYARRSYWKLGVSLLAFGALIEVCQYASGYRSAEWLDLAADFVGIAVGLMLAWTGVGGWSLRLEDWLRVRSLAGR